MTVLLRPGGCDKEESALLLESHLWTDRTSPTEKRAAVSFNQGDRFTFQTEKRVHILYFLFDCLFVCFICCAACLVLTDESRASHGS